MPSSELRDLRTLLMHRHQWVRMRTRVQKHAASHGHRSRPAARQGPVEPNRPTRDQIVAVAAYRRTELQDLYQKLDAQIEELDKRVGDQALQRPGAKLLMSHPGVGPVTALATDVFLGDPARFADGKAVVSYVGMIPSEYSSGGQQRLGGLSKQGNPFLRFLWCEAAVHAVRRDPELQRFYRRKLAQKGWVKREWPQLASSGSGCGSCCASRSITKSSVAAARRGRKTVVPVRGCHKWVIVLRGSDLLEDGLACHSRLVSAPGVSELPLE